MASTINNLQDTVKTAGESQSFVAETKAVIDTTWSVLSFVLGSESAWAGYDADEL
jgi:hypothetical protein